MACCIWRRPSLRRIIDSRRTLHLSHENVRSFLSFSDSVSMWLSIYEACLLMSYQSQSLSYAQGVSCRTTVYTVVTNNVIEAQSSIAKHLCLVKKQPPTFVFASHRYGEKTLTSPWRWPLERLFASANTPANLFHEFAELNLQFPIAPEYHQHGRIERGQQQQSSNSKRERRRLWFWPSDDSTECEETSNGDWSSRCVVRAEKSFQCRW